MASVWEWVVEGDDERTRITLSRGWTGRISVHVNGQQSQTASSNGTRPLLLDLPAGRAELPYGTDWLVGFRCELRLEGQLLLPRRAPKGVATALSACPSCKGNVEATDRFCEGCGKALPTAEQLVKLADVRRGTSAIGYLSFAYAAWGAFMYLAQRVEADKALAKISSYDASAPLVDPVPGVSARTFGELRTQIEWEVASGLIVNLVLASIMLGLWLWGKRKPSSAIIVAACTYAAVLVTNIALDPSTIMQGWIIKLVIILALSRGLKAALALRGTAVSGD